MKMKRVESNLKFTAIMGLLAVIGMKQRKYRQPRDLVIQKK